MSGAPSAETSTLVRAGLMGAACGLAAVAAAYALLGAVVDRLKPGQTGWSLDSDGIDAMDFRPRDEP